MRSIAKVFGRSPFVPLQAHMEKVAECVGRLPEILDAYERGETERVAELAAAISKIEHAADLLKDDIRNDLPRGLFMPVDRANILQILSTQDTIADRAENVAVLLTFKQARTVESVATLFRAFVVKVLESFDECRHIIGELDELLETGFGGAEAQKVRDLVKKVAVREHEADVAQRELIRELLRQEDELSYGDFFLWTRIIRQLAQVADRAENLANAVGTILENK
ncbi:MAG: TIGR00153 family protein [Planctomycetota bacterium]|jgi:predicted phosphate transport protein (TIGR00153 family)